MLSLWAGFGAWPLWGKMLAELLVLLFLAWLLGQLCRILLRRVLHRLPHHPQPWWDAEVLINVARVVPSLCIQFGAYGLQYLPPTPVMVLRTLATAFTIFHLMRAVVALLDAVHRCFQQRSVQAQERSLTSYVQLGRLLAYVIGTLLIAATLLDRSPLLLFSGLGAMSAVLMLVFKDTILSFVAGVQLASNDMLRVGDWLEMPQENADGTVLDIGLNTVKVQNWDKTVTTIPTWKLMSESFKNWRAMFESGGRRIKRALNLDASKVRIMDAAQRQALLQQYPQLAAFFQDPLYAQATNLAAFMAYAQAYLKSCPDISQADDMQQLVRLREPTALGLPLQIYAFTTDTTWARHEAVQDAVFDHLMGMLSHFGLAMYQRSSDRPAAV